MKKLKALFSRKKKPSMKEAVLIVGGEKMLAEMRKMRNAVIW